MVFISSTLHIVTISTITTCIHLRKHYKYLQKLSVKQYWQYQYLHRTINPHSKPITVFHSLFTLQPICIYHKNKDESIKFSPYNPEAKQTAKKRSLWTQVSNYQNKRDLRKTTANNCFYYNQWKILVNSCQCKVNGFLKNHKF